MNNRKLLMLCVGVKFMALSLCLSMIGVSLVIGQIWFSPTASFDDVEEELASGKDSRGRALNINMISEDGYTGVMRAVQVGDVKLLNTLIKYGANVNLSSPKDDDQTALHFALFNGDHQHSWEYDGRDGFIKILLKNGADPRIIDKRKRTPLHLLQEIDDRKTRLAVCLAMIDQVRTLVKKEGGDTAAQKKAVVEFINAKNADGNTILHMASSGNDTPWIRVLQDSEFFCDIDAEALNEDEETALEASPTQEVKDAMKNFVFAYKKCKKRR